VTRPPAPVASRRERRATARLEQPAAPRRAQRGARTPAWRSPLAIASLVAVVIGGALVILATRPAVSTASDLRIPTSAYPATLTRGAALGNPAAPVTIELFADFQCPACKQFVTTQLSRVVTDFVTPGIARIEAKDIDILGRGTPDESMALAVGAACAAEQNRYWQYHDLVFWNQGRENHGDHDAAFVAAVANEARVDETAWRSCLGREDVTKTITDQTRTALSAGINSTPTLRVNGEILVGVPNYADLAALITRLAGVPRASAPPAAP
jgi:protein-disulfide isomerase